MSESKTCCEIQWVNGHGDPTPDTNPAVGECYPVSHLFVWPDGRTTWIDHSDARRYPICAAHKCRLDALPNWRFIPYIAGEER